MAKIEIKDLKGFPDYYAGSDGLIYTTKVSYRYNPKGELRILRPRTHPSGYLYYGLFVGLGPNKQRLWRRGHRLIAETFIGKIPKKMEINHVDGNKHNNNPSNLEIVTRHQNLIHYHTILKPKRNVRN
jgi:hypothetical protein